MNKGMTILKTKLGFGLLFFLLQLMMLGCGPAGSNSGTAIPSDGYTISSISGNTTEASSGQATFTIKLNTAPSSNVILDVASSDTSEGTVSVSVLAFTPLNYATAQTVTVTGVDDSLDDGNVDYTIQLSINSFYTLDTIEYKNY